MSQAKGQPQSSLRPPPPLQQRRGYLMIANDATGPPVFIPRQELTQRFHLTLR